MLSELVFVVTLIGWFSNGRKIRIVLQDLFWRNYALILLLQTFNRKNASIFYIDHPSLILHCYCIPKIIHLILPLFQINSKMPYIINQAIRYKHLQSYQLDADRDLIIRIRLELAQHYSDCRQAISEITKASTPPRSFRPPCSLRFG